MRKTAVKLVVARITAVGTAAVILIDAAARDVVGYALAKCCAYDWKRMHSAIQRKGSRRLWFSSFGHLLVAKACKIVGCYGPTYPNRARHLPRAVFPSSFLRPSSYSSLASPCLPLPKCL